MAYPSHGLPRGTRCVPRVPCGRRGLRRRHALALALVAASQLAQSPTGADDQALQAARSAVADGKYGHARELLMPLARKGHAQAQAGLGTLYMAGNGVDRDYEQAAKWFQLAADQGNALGQFNLGVCYLHGRGVEEDPVEALKWVSLAASQGFPQAQQLHPAIAGSLSRRERDEGKRRAREWKAR